MRRASLCCFFIALLYSLLVTSVSAATLRVGPGQPYTKPCAAIAAAAPGDTILIEASGAYAGDVCSWTKSGLTLRGVNGRPVIDAAGANAAGKGTWVIGGSNNVVENIEFTGAAVPDMNGAGIRFEGVNLTVRGCYFHDNENGILTNSVGSGELLVEYSEFARNGAGDGQSHNIYVNRISRLIFQFNYSHDAKSGHLLKSRAAQNHILYNRLTTESGTTSYEVDIPNGGLTYLIGNVLLQGPSGENNSFVSYMREGPNAFNPSSSLYVVNNTFVNKLAGGVFLNIYTGDPTPVVARNNIFAGPGTVVNQGAAVLSNNYSGANPGFVNEAGFDYHLRSDSPAINTGADPGSGDGMALTPAYEYSHPVCRSARAAAGSLDAGAFEFGNTGSALSCSATGGSGLTSLSVNPSSVTAGASAAGSLQFDTSAPAGGTAVTLSSSAPQAAAGPSSLTVPAGASSASFVVTTGAVASATPVTLTATAGGISRTAALTVSPAASLSGVAVSPQAVFGGVSATGTVQLDNPAPTGGAVVTITSANPAVAAAPATVTVPGGSAAATFPVTTTDVPGPITVTLTATYFTTSRTTTLAVSPQPALSSVSVAPASVFSGAAASGTVQLNVPAPAGGITVTLTSSNPGAASVPASVVVTEGNASAAFPISTFGVASPAAVTITAAYGGGIRTTSLTVSPRPAFQFRGSSAEIPALVAGTTVTPSIAPAGLGATLVVRGTGAATFLPVVNGDGIAFSKTGQQASNTAFVKFSGGSVSYLFNLSQGDLTFYLKSAYSLAERVSQPYHYAFQVDDGTQRLFFFAVTPSGSRLAFSYATGITGSLAYFVPVGQEDAVFGKNVVAKFRLTWDGSRTNLYLNDTLVASTAYTKAVANWTSAASFTIGATSVYPYGGGYFASDDPIADFRIADTGTPTPQAPQASLSPTSVSFGNQTTGSPTAAQTVTVTNTGNAALTISSIAITGANASDFSQTNNCGVSLAASSSCAINVIFTPTAAGSRSASLSVTDSAAGSPHSVALSGSGVVPSSGGPTFYLRGNNTEIPSLANGASVTPSNAPSGVTSSLVVRGTGGATFVPVVNGDGIGFSKTGQQASNTAFLKFSGTPISSLFNLSQGDLTFYLKSSYSLSERVSQPYHYAFQVDDGTQRLFFFAVTPSGSRLAFSYATGITGSLAYFVPVGQEDAVFGKNVVAKFRLTWDGSRTNLYLNDTLVASTSYTKAVANWTSAASFTIGATSVYPYGGGYFASDDPIAGFRIE